MKKLKITVLPGEGVGQDLTLACIPVFSALKIPVDFQFGEIGFEAWEHSGNALPNKSLEFIKSSDATLIGAVRDDFKTKSINKNNINQRNPSSIYLSPIPQLKEELDIYASVIVKVNIFNAQVSKKAYICKEILLGEENVFSSTESKINKENKLPSHEKELCTIDMNFSFKQLIEFAFQYAAKNHYPTVILENAINAERSNIESDFFKKIAGKYPKINNKIIINSNLSIAQKKDHVVIISPNCSQENLSETENIMLKKFSSIVHFGLYGCYFQPFIADNAYIKPYNVNPISMFLAIALMLKTLGYKLEADTIEKAVQNIIVDDKCLILNLKCKYSTLDLANIIIDEVSYLRDDKQLEIAY